MAFLTQLDDASCGPMEALIMKHICAGMRKPRKELLKPPRRRGGSRTKDTLVLVEHFWLTRGPLPPLDLSLPDPTTGSRKFVTVPSVKRHIRNLARAVLSGRHPVLLQVSHKGHCMRQYNALTLRACLCVRGPLRVARPRWWSTWQLALAMCVCASTTTSTRICKSTLAPTSLTPVASWCSKRAPWLQLCGEVTRLAREFGVELPPLTTPALWCHRLLDHSG